MSGININPLPMTTAAGTFAVQSSGYIQGDFMADPSARNWISGGYLDPASASPVWGGVGICELGTPQSGAGITAPITPLGSKLQIASQIAQGAGNLSGFVTTAQGHNAITAPQSPAPTFLPGMSLNFFRLGSKARIPLMASAGLVANEGLVTSTPVSWDFLNQQLVPYVAAYAGATSTSATYSPTTGLLALTFAAPVAVVATDYVSVYGYTGANLGLNGTWAVTNVTGNVVTVQAPTGLTTASTTPTGGAIAGGGGAIPGLQVLDIQIGNSMTIVYNPVTGYATWNRSGSCALCLLN